MKINQVIFKSYDIRGIYPNELNEETAKLIAQAFLKIVSARQDKAVKDLKIIVSRDNRKGSAPLIQKVVETFLASGVKVDDIGLASTNDFYFAVGNYQYDGGINATASHNPPEYSGFKMAVFNQAKKALEFIPGIELYGELLKMKFPKAVEKIPGTIKKKESSCDKY